ncbi:MAG: type I DNA topoisomerase [Pirellulales bacterium]|nr:type I DNA topoisomerase [Pirellulales bacterium]
MAKASAAKPGKPLMIVESPAKARTIKRFLGDGYIIEASIGHVRDLPEGAKQVPAKYKGEDWAYLGVNVKSDFDPVYVIPPGKTQQVRKLKDLLKEASALYLATDEDREGEAISWHLHELLQPKVPVKRLVFHEITKEAIDEAVSQPRGIDEALVQAQETRRIVDRLYGYEVSPLLWRKIKPRLSAGRVQSVAVRLIVDRERERMAFVSATYWDLLGRFAKLSGEEFQAELVSVDGQSVPSARDFDPATGRLKNPQCVLLDETRAKALAERLATAEFRVISLDDKPYTSKPYPPFTTSTLQQEANRKLRFTARRTMKAAQSLYENGHITYMRTDSTNLAKVAVEAARDLVASQYGREYLPDQARSYQTKVKNAQEAHEAIRPAGHPFPLPETLRGRLDEDEFKLYDLIWKRTVASQMADSRGRRISIEVEGAGALFQVGGKTIDFAGYLRAYVEGADDPQAELADRETVLPSVAVGEQLRCLDLSSKSHTTQPPARYTEATLTKSLEELGIGRPSTYAAIIDTILARDYVFKRGNALVPTWTAFAVANLLEQHLPKLVDYQFTAQMEDDLDAISRGEAERVDYLRRFYYGNGQPGLKTQLEKKVDTIDARHVNRIPIARIPGVDGPEGEIVVRVGRFGPFLEQGERRASLPEGTAPDEVNLDSALKLLSQAAAAEEPLGFCPETGKPVFLKTGRFGPYVQRGTTEDEEKPKNASLLRGMQPQDVTLEMALRLLSLPRTLGVHPTTGEAIVASNGRFGPYVKCGNETRSLPESISILDVTEQQALELLAQPKAARRGFGQVQVVRMLEESPVTKQPVQVLNGRYGLYVSDGTTNASLPKEQKAEDLTLAAALELLAARAAMGPPKKGAARRKTFTPKAKPAAAASNVDSTAPPAAKKKTAKKAAARRPAKSGKK